MKITTLIDNVVYGNKLVAEHGFSLYIESNDKKILFDTGQSKNFIDNAINLGIDISKIDFCIISHGHYDHTGGLYDFCKINKKAKIFIKKEAFLKKYKSNKNYIGIPFNENIFEDRLIFVSQNTKITDDIYIMPDIKIYNYEDTHFKEMSIKQNNEYFTDEFIDEQFLVINQNNSLVIISGCSHRGITNIIKTSIEYFNLPINLVLGGFHFKDEDDKTLKNIIESFNNFNIKQIGVSHCTGIDKLINISKSFLGNIFYNYTGNLINL
ncbi:MAG: hypothetical protein A2Y34_13725 [Spirochaetes bacterium GWC1_27_15]|nr:MAG: hypothetical protein A2Z98_06405 [Spirochaetes bacterium GWB1_27_13]OHD27527.1 MAG: hypothetical protein A2Y34_13725 [Spirochaetes bacterium GWC1_27_15]